MYLHWLSALAVSGGTLTKDREASRADFVKQPHPPSNKRSTLRLLRFRETSHLNQSGEHPDVLSLASRPRGGRGSRSAESQGSP